MKAKLKPNATSVIAGMTPKQRELLEHWLFDKNVSYNATAALCKKEFKIKVNRDSLQNFYHKRAVERKVQENIDRIAQRGKHAKRLMAQFEKNGAKMFPAVLGIIGQIAFDEAAETEEGKVINFRRLREILRLLITARKDEREDGKFLLERERWEVDVARLCAEHHTELQAIAANDSLDEGERLQAIRHRLFGDRPKELEFEPQTGAVKPA